MGSSVRWNDENYYWNDENYYWNGEQAKAAVGMAANQNSSHTCEGRYPL